MGVFLANVQAGFAILMGWIVAAWAWFSATLLCRIISMVLIIIVAVVLGWKLLGVLFGWWSPPVKSAMVRWSANQEIGMANSINKRNVQSEAEAGITATVNEKSKLYMEDGSLVKLKDSDEFLPPIEKGAKVMVLDLKRRAASDGLEGMVRIMLRNPDGDFVKDNHVVFIPARKLDLVP